MPELDLYFRTPPPPSDLLDRARDEGRRLRRRRRTGLAAAVLIGTAGAAAVAVPLARDGGFEDRVVASGTTGLTMFAYAPEQIPPTASTPLTDDMPAEQARALDAIGPVHLLRDDGGDQKRWIYVKRSPEGAGLGVATTTTIDSVPRESLGTGLRLAGSEGLGVVGSVSFDNGSPAILFGVYQGPVSRVVVSHPDRQVDARLAEVAGIGTLWWAVTPVLQYGPPTVGPNEQRYTPGEPEVPYEQQQASLTQLVVTAYDGNEPVHGCRYADCTFPWDEPGLDGNPSPSPPTL